MTLKIFINPTFERMIIINKEKFLNWLKCAGIRAIKTVAETAIASIGVSAMMSEVNWIAVGSTALLSGILSILISIKGLPEAKTE